MCSDASSPPGDAVIAARGLTKVYRIWADPAARFKAPALAALANAVPSPAARRRLHARAASYFRDFHALKDVSLEVRRGETVGIIGRNGAGKSTLLQIIAGVLRPTAGEVDVAGRVAALLELGSGFNPEFTGRENVFLNGTILGLGEREVREHFDAIAAFADIGAFIDQPVKIYSSGMMVRLAFAVQAFLEPDVLIVDEALAVGDLPFQHRCMRRIAQLVDGGTAVLYVSHATDTVKRFCRRCLWLDGGETRFFGPAGVGVEKYLGFIRMREAGAQAPADAPAALARAAAPAESEDGALLPVAGDIDLSDERLFVRGAWREAPGAAPGTVRRETSDDAALAAFRFEGDRVELLFRRGPGARRAVVALDGREHPLDLRDPAGPGLHPFTLATAPGRHVLSLRPLPAGDPADALTWLGGRVEHGAAPPAFRRDPAPRAEDEVGSYGTARGRITAVELLDYASLEPVTELAFGRRVRLRIHAERLGDLGPEVSFSFIVRDANRIDLFGATTASEHVRVDARARRFVAEFAFTVRLGPGSYSVLAAFVEGSENLPRKTTLHHVDLACVFRVGFDPARPVWYAFHEPVTVRVSAETGEP